ncbi:hypothetical protein [Mesorhizobium sp. LjNodule214]|uniref:hypothetical protein n=1 Tax=Mesorhizobium sp. LjNodule214 TaxID=3342252 RepID=UPI003ECE425F
MPAVTRRTLLAFTAVASVVEPTFAEGEGISRELQALIATHEVTYNALHRVVHRADSSWHDRKSAGRIEEEALLAICSYPATSRGDRRAKAEYLSRNGANSTWKSTCRQSCTP